MTHQGGTLESSGDSFGPFFENSPFPYHSLDSQGRLLAVNKAWQDLLGYSKQEVIGRPLTEFIIQEDQPGFLESFPRAVAERDIIQAEFRLRKKQDGIADCLIRGAIRRDEKGKFIQTHCILFDISHIQRIEAEIQKSRREWKDIFDGIGHMAQIIDPDHKIIYANKTTLEMLGLSQEELSGRKCHEIFHGTKSPPPNCPLPALKEKGISSPVEMELEMLGRTYLVHCTPIYDKDRHLTKIVHIATDITSHKNFEKALIQSETRFRELADLLPEAIFETDLSGRLTYLNAAAFETSGYTRQDFEKGLSAASLVAAQDRDRVGQNIKNVLNGQVIGLQEYTAQRRDGSTFPCLLRSSAIFSEGRPVGLRSFVIDNTAFKDKEAGITLLMERYQELYEHMSDGVAIYQPVDDGRDFIFTDMNQAGLTITGLGLKDLLNRRVTEVFPGVEEMGLLAVLQRVCRTGRAERFPVSIYHDERLTTWMDNYVYRLSTGEVVAIFEDITTQKQALERLEKENSFRKTIIDKMTEGLCVCRQIDEDPFLQFTVWNRRMVELTGFTMAEINTAGWYQSIYPDLDYRTQAVNRMDRLRRGGELAAEQWRIVTKDGQKKNLEISTALLNTGSEKPDIMALIVDVTDRIRQEQERQSIEAQLRQAQKMEAVGTLAGGIAHDFNNILAAILGFADLAVEDAALGKDNTAGLNEIIKAGQRAKNLVTQILTFSRKLEPSLKAVDLNHIIRQAEIMLERTLPKMISLENNLAGDLWPIEADQNQVTQILLNLASNANDAMPQGGRLAFETANVVLDETFFDRHLEVRPGNYVLLSVSDTGVGMSKEKLDSIFDPFFTDKEVGKGTGLGLASVYGIVQSHDGYIHCYSELGQGTTFKIYLPAAIRAGKVAEERQPKTAPPLRQATILLVDDEPSIRDFGSRFLVRHGYEVLTAETGEQALEICNEKTSEIDLVILDISMPGMGGHKCLEELNRLYPQIKVIISSGYSKFIQLQQSDNALASGFLAKPFTRAEMLELVGEVLKGG